MVADPRISAVQAAAILGCTAAQVYRLIAKGRLPAHGEKNSFRRLLLSDVEGAGYDVLRQRVQRLSQLMLLAEACGQ